MISNLIVFIIDKNGGFVLIGVLGEFCVGGDGVVKGYLNRFELISEVFVSYLIYFEEKIYRIGDLVYWLFDGSIGYISCIDC